MLIWTCLKFQSSMVISVVKFKNIKFGTFFFIANFFWNPLYCKVMPSFVMARHMTIDRLHFAIISFEHVDFWLKIMYLILYPSVETLITHNAILLCNLTQVQISILFHHDSSMQCIWQAKCVWNYADIRAVDCCLACKIYVKRADIKILHSFFFFLTSS